MLNDIIFISMKPHVSDARYTEVESEFKRKMADKIAIDLRNRIDPGLTFRGHQRTQSLKVNVTDAGNINITADSPGKDVTKSDKKERTDPSDRDSIDDLFTQSSGVPKVIEGDGGAVRVAFRTIREDDLFKRTQEQQDGEVKRLVDYAVQSNTVDVMNDAVSGVEQRYPTDTIGSEERTQGDE